LPEPDTAALQPRGQFDRQLAGTTSIPSPPSAANLFSTSASKRAPGRGASTGGVPRQVTQT
jgi:hypothetical protein